MPELPEVDALATGLATRMAGHRVTRATLTSFSALKTVDPALEELVGRSVAGVARRGKFVALEAEGVWLVVHLARGGWIRWHERLPPTALRPGRSPIVLRLGLDDDSGLDVTEAGTEKRVALWVVRHLADVPAVAALGPDPLDPHFEADQLAGLLAATRGTLKTVLTTQTLIAGVGNAYSDEVLHRARLSPYARADRLGAAGVATLHAALVGVLGEAAQRAAAVPLAELKGDKRRAMEVHGRTGQPCPVCGDTVRQVAFASRSLQYCPTCQTGGRILADRRLSRLLK